MKARAIQIFICLLILSVSTSARAADLLPALAPQPQAETKDGWSFTVAPYFWLAGISGDTGVFGLPTVDIDQSFSDIISDLDFGFMAAGEARYGRISILTDILYIRITTDAATPRGIIASEVDLKSETFTAFVGGGYTVLEDNRGRLDVTGGIRVWDVDTKISFTGGLLGGRSRSDGATWVDGLGGFRGTYSITPQIYLTGWAMIGGGGADLDWDVLAGIGYNFDNRISAVAGYRALGVDYSDDGFVFDAIQHGPILGVAIRF
ncbi:MULTISPECIES: hypothetical protein [unclassified Sinorhizobium]|uniref:hypothetical protein n=1 Tax=unclassified Sinorhizobium TaxID=2613772 RepID=UPI003525C0EF